MTSWRVLCWENLSLNTYWNDPYDLFIFLKDFFCKSSMTPRKRWWTICCSRIISLCCFQKWKMESKRMTQRQLQRSHVRVDICFMWPLTRNQDPTLCRATQDHREVVCKGRLDLDPSPWLRRDFWLDFWFSKTNYPDEHWVTLCDKAMCHLHNDDCILWLNRST